MSLRTNGNSLTGVHETATLPSASISVCLFVKLSALASPIDIQTIFQISDNTGPPPTNFLEINSDATNTNWVLADSGSDLTGTTSIVGQWYFLAASSIAGGVRVLYCMPLGGGMSRFQGTAQATYTPSFLAIGGEGAGGIQSDNPSTACIAGVRVWNNVALSQETFYRESQSIRAYSRANLILEWPLSTDLDLTDQVQGVQVSGTAADLSPGEWPPGVEYWPPRKQVSYSVPSVVALEETGGYWPRIFEGPTPCILASGAEDVSVTPLKIDEFGPNPPPLFDMGREVFAIGAFSEDVAVTPIKVDDVGVPLAPIFDPGQFILASAEEPAVTPLQIDDVGVPLQPLFDPGQYQLATAEEPAVVPLQIDDVGVPLPPLFVDGRFILATAEEPTVSTPALDDSSVVLPFPFSDGLAILATAEEPAVTPLQIDETGPVPLVWSIDTPFLLAQGDDTIVSTVALEDVAPPLPMLVADGRIILASSEEPVVTPLQVDETSPIPIVWWSDGFGILATSDDSIVVPTALEDTGSYWQPIVADTLSLRPIAEDSFPSSSTLDESSPALVWYPVSTLSVQSQFDEFPVSTLALEETSLVPSWPHRETYLSLVWTADELPLLQLAYVYMGASSVLAPHFPPSLALRPYTSPSSTLLPSFPTSVISPPKRS